MADTPVTMMPPETLAERTEADARLWRLACAEEREACAQLVESQKDLRSSSWHASRIRARGTT